MKGFTETDMVVSLALFLIFLMVISVSLTSHFSSFKSGNDEEILESQARDTINMMVKSPGFPKNWENDVNSIESFGLSYHSYFTRANLLDFRKINASNSVAYDDLVSILDLKDVKIIIEDIDLNVSYVIGSDSNRKNLVSLERYVAIRYSYHNVSKGKINVIQWI